MQELKKFYTGKNIIITGHTGFKGSWLSHILNQMGANCIGISDKIPTTPSHFDLLNLKLGENVDINNFNHVKKIFHDFNPDIVFHLAAQSLVLKSYTNPVETFQTNIIGTANLFECARSTKSVRAFLNVTSDKCYLNQEWDWGYKEIDPLGGHDPYSASKACAEIIHQSYLKSFFNSTDAHCLIASVRSGNIIGGGDWSDNRIIPDIIRAIKNNEELIIRNPLSYRPWQHVLDPIVYYLKIGMGLHQGNKSFAQSFNLGPLDAENITVEEIVTIAKSYFPQMSYRIESNNLHEAKNLKLDCSRAIKILNWKPRMNSKVSIEETLKWYAEYLATGKIITDQQINHYFSL